MRTTLERNVTSEVMHHVHAPSWLFEFMITAAPALRVDPVVLEARWPRPARAAPILSSSRFLTDHTALPRGRPRDVVAPDLDVARHVVGHRRVGAAEHDHLARALEVVVHDLVRPGTVPAHDRLRVPAHGRGSPRGRNRQPRNSALFKRHATWRRSERRPTMHVASVEHEAARHLSWRLLVRTTGLPKSTRSVCPPESGSHEADLEAGQAPTLCARVP